MALIYGNKFIDFEILNERKIITSKEDNICITLDGNGQTNRGFINDPYFKVYASQTAKSGTKVARLKLKEPKYVVHNNQKWDMNKKELKLVNKYLDKIVEVNGEKMTAWELIKRTAIAEGELDNDSRLSKEEKERIRQEILSLEKPDYTKTKY